MRKFPTCPPTANPKRKYCHVYTTKSGGYDLYKWSPPPNDVKPKQVRQRANPYYCNARPYTNGQDWITTYCYNEIVSPTTGEVSRSAYVECDYVL